MRATNTLSELCDLRIRHVRLHDPGGARFHVPDSKTETGIRIVEMSPDLAEAFVDHLDRLRRAGNRTEPDEHVVQNVRGGRISRQRVAKIVREASTLATERRSERGLPPLPRTMPHSLRRTYISIALLANRFDVKWVMSQVGHADSKMTLDVYAQLEQRVKREHRVRFDAVVRDARVQLHGAQMRPERRRKGDGARRGRGSLLATSSRARRYRLGGGHPAMARSGLEPVRTASPVTGMDAFTASRWRDPDSNRGHHDFQAPGPGGRKDAGLQALRRSRARPRCRRFPAASCGFRPRARRSWPKIEIHR
jgi:hypothetical protein